MERYRNFVNSSKISKFLGLGVCLTVLAGGSPAGTAQDSVLSTLKPKAILQAAQAGDTTQALASGLNSLAETGSWFTEEWFRTFVPTAEIKIRLSDDLKPVGSALFLVPLFERTEAMIYFSLKAAFPGLTAGPPPISAWGIVDFFWMKSFYSG